MYIYLLAPFTRLFRLTPAIVRSPAALCGLAVSLLVGATARRITDSFPLAVLSVLTAGLTPWLVLESPFGHEVITEVLFRAARHGLSPLTRPGTLVVRRAHEGRADDAGRLQSSGGLAGRGHGRQLHV